MPTFEYEGAELYYESYGSGPTVVFCHGAGGNHISWFQQIPRLSSRYRCVTFDHRGWGRSLDPRPVAERPPFDDDLAALIDRLELEDVRLVAQSMGGWTALAYTVKHPERVKALIMADTVGGLTSPELDAAREETRKVIAEKGLLEGALSEGFRKRTASGAFLYEQIWGLNPPREESGSRPMGFLPVTVEEAEALEVPVLFIEGREDILIPPDVVKMAAKLIPGARVQVVSEAGHSVYFERPGEFNRLVSTFLRNAERDRKRSGGSRKRGDKSGDGGDAADGDEKDGSGKD
ncbi:MAG: alpha/beta fold hydrolase [Dehalococcoidia bacterium]